MELLQIRTESEQDSLTTGPPLVGEMVGRGLCGLVTLSLYIYIYYSMPQSAAFGTGSGTRYMSGDCGPSLSTQALPGAAAAVHRRRLSGPLPLASRPHGDSWHGCVQGGRRQALDR